MTKDQIKAFLRDKPGYLKEGAERLSERLDCSVEACRNALKEARIEAKGNEFDLDNVNTQELSGFKQFLQTIGIAEETVSSVKFWQNVSGENRFSVVVKGEDNIMKEIKEEIIESHEKYSPKVEKKYESVNDPIVYEVSLPDIHYGKIDGQTLDEAEEAYMHTIKDLMIKASGLNIDRILLPVGNDGMNSEGYSRATTKGTSQQDSAGWQETFVGYCSLMVRAICYLARTAPVDVVVIQGNHDYERM